MDFFGFAVNFLKPFSLAFLPIFVAMEPVGVIPVYLSLTRNMSEAEKRNTLFYSILTATAITFAFLAVGKVIFLVLGITIKDFQIAGGLVLLAIAISEIVQTARGIPERMPKAAEIGIVPIGIPLIAGPAALTTILMLNDLYGFTVTAAALFANLLIVWYVFLSSDTITKYIGENGAKGISKVIYLLLAAIAVMMIRRGLQGTLFL